MIGENVILYPGVLAMNRGFTLMEIIIVVVILGIMASLAIPKVIGPNERVRASEGFHILSVLLNAQRSYSLENANNYATALSSLDVTFPAAANFNAPTVANNAAAVASIVRNNGNYTLSINDTGVISCSETVAGSCAAISCNQGAGTQCN